MRCVLLDSEVELQLTGDGWLEGKVRVKGVSILEPGQKIIAHAKGLSSVEERDSCYKANGNR